VTDEGPNFSVDVVHLDGSAELVVTGELDISTGAALRCAVAKVVGPHLRGVTIDVGRLTFVDVAGLRAIVGAQEMSVTAGAEFTLASVGSRTQRVIQLAGFHELEALLPPVQTGSDFGTGQD
jgi:anti-sigma B factor antagonist